ncbi:lipolytic protein G-D-S-L family [Pseudoxanthomonas suwonensis 11-1]|uniref:Lipolytic protein G-D-S-L family n=1 Tax=Pseudoxanthomonas suwonensis (strain 11-1) TaxID=743721 RepID=E6WSI0_PSEUU|nr:SGNH/GDSL hydrolase family protein [Pseudoxanthomonas suwonensis]ADV27194.1 lipolytic protein G-D-S-L family [Pseudoxanthomonas suwonensis 11-1]
MARRLRFDSLAFVLLLALVAPVHAQVRVAADPALQATPAPVATGGRTVAHPRGLAHQWPGVYFETAFEGSAAGFELVEPPLTVHVEVDGQRVASLRKPSPGRYRIDGMDPGTHALRLETASESQSAAHVFGGFLLPPGSSPAELPRRERRIEFIGDSHTVGYGSVSTTRECSGEEVDMTTDTSAAFGPQVAKHYNADYRINAISGRGIVRNYSGHDGDTVPTAWPYLLLSHEHVDSDTSWQPQVVVVALGTNDFSTALNEGEPWADRAALRADYVHGYTRFVRQLRARWPGAHFVLWATDAVDGEIRDHARQVATKLLGEGDRRISFLPVDGLDMQACHWHPSAADHVRLRDALVAHIDALPSPWGTAGD